MAAITSHENPNVQIVLDTLTRANLECREVGVAADPPEGPAVIVNGTQDLEGCRTRFLQTIDALEAQTGRPSIRDTTFDRALYDSVQIFRINGEVINFVLAK